MPSGRPANKKQWGYGRHGPPLGKERLRMQLTSHGQLEIPESLRKKLLAYRSRVWRLKMIEAFAAAMIGVLIGFLLTYALDRFFDTPRILRGLIFLAAMLACALVPLALERWVWRRRRMDQLARLLSQTHPNAGDQLLGVIELSEDTSEQSRSPVLVQAAIKQVAANVERQDLRDAIPNPRHLQRGWAAGVLAAMAMMLLVVTAPAAKNAWARFLKPWGDTPRYTFAAIEPLPERLVVPHGESFEVSIALDQATQWKPSQAEVRLSGHTSEQASLENEGYRFQLPGQIEDTQLQVKVGDFSGQTAIEPKLRPELSSISAEVKLPEYLGRSENLKKDVRGGTMSVVKGSQTTLTATASRELASALVNGQPRQPQADHFSTAAVTVDESSKIEMRWQDHFGLSGRKPFELTIEGVDDETPSLICENLPRRKVLLDSEVLTFKVRARDDFGVKRVGIQWQGLDNTVKDVAQGEQVIGAGSHEADFLELAATFSAAKWKIEPQPIAVRVFVEDYYPDRERVYSPTCIFDVLNAEQHAIWITSQLSRWHRMSLDVRDREMQLYETNKQLRDLTPQQLDEPETRRQLSSQAQRERANGRRLTDLVRGGEDLLREAMRNPEIGVGHLDKWAEMMQILKDISGNRMPSVADLLKQASKAQMADPKSPADNAPKAGQNRLTQSAGGDPSKQDESPEPPPAVPTISDIESSHQQPEPTEPSEPGESKPGAPRLTLPSTMLAGGVQKGDQPPPPANEQLDQAVKQQQDLLAEFEKIVDELNNVLANLEGSTLVKRLKASSRKQQQVATKLGSLASEAFGVSNQAKQPNAETFSELSEAEAVSSQEASHIMDDMSAYFERSRFMRFRAVLDDMREQDVTAGLRHLSDDLQKENGLSIAQAEFWSESFDRWAEDLVEVTKGGL